MKKSRIIASVCVFILIISTLCACEITFGGESTTTTTTTTATTTTTQAPGETTSTTTTTTEKKVETDSLDTILNLIKDFPMGTAGSSVKAANIANRLVNFTEHSGFDINEVKHDYENFLNTLSDTQKLIYEENLAEIDYIARKIIKGEDSHELSLSDYQATPKKDGKFSLISYETLYEVISK
ncbi:MAG: hypothetical protein IKJ69_03380 [Clostridia bacterium]|nr:hypothetical protein [Clostridia bacterium]